MPATTKFLAIGEFTAAATPDQLDAHMNQKVPATLKLYLDGKMDQFWLRLDGKGVVFVVTTETSQEAEDLLRALPLGKLDLLRFTLIPIGTLSPLGVLMGKHFTLNG